MTSEENQQLILEIRNLLGDEFQELRQDVKLVGNEVHEVRNKLEGFVQRLTAAETSILEGKTIVVPLESRVTRLEDIPRRVTLLEVAQQAIQEKSIQTDNKLTAVQTGLKVVVGLTLAIPTLIAIITRFAQ